MELIFGVLWWIYAVTFIMLVLFATFHHHLNLRKRYIDALLKLFAFGHERVERKRLKVNGTGNQDEPETPLCVSERPLISPDNPKALGIKEDIKGFHLDHVLDYITAGMSSIMDDSLTKYFEPEELPMWNLLMRNNDRAYEFVSFRLTMCWIFGFFIRYFILFPLRLIILLSGLCLLCITMAFVGLFPEGKLKRWMNRKLQVICFDFIASSLSLVATFHDEENIPKCGIAVANHTSPIDSMVLATNSCYDMVGQKHDGFLGLVMDMLSRASTHVWFERTDAKDRSLVIKKLRDHASDPDLPPILIYPEGVCVNNTSVMQFKKGAFEIDTVIYPIAIRFDARFGDAFWWQDKFFLFILHMLTSWAIVCNVWYLPPMTRNPEESAIAFADRVKAKIAHQGGLIDLSWDGFLKVKPPKAELKKRQQEEFAKHLRLSESTENSEKEKEE